MSLNCLSVKTLHITQNLYFVDIDHSGFELFFIFMFVIIILNHSCNKLYINADTWWLTLDNFGNGSDFQWPVQFRRQQQTSRISDAAYSKLTCKWTGCCVYCNATQFSGPVCAGARSSVIFSVKASCTYLVVCVGMRKIIRNCGGGWGRLLNGGVFLRAHSIPYI